MPIECKIEEAVSGIDAHNSLTPRRNAQTHDACALLFSVQCPGVDALAISSNLETTNTQVCSSNYAGLQCGQCAVDSYQLSSRCYSCGQSVDQSRVILLTGIIAIAAMIVLSMGIALLDVNRLVSFAQMFIIFQGVVMISVEGVQSLPVGREELGTIATYANFVNADIALIRPGCGGVPSFSWISKLQITVLLLFLSGAVFLTACLIRYCLHRRNTQVQSKEGSQPQKPVSSDWEHLKHRSTHAMILLLSIFVSSITAPRALFILSMRRLIFVPCASCAKSVFGSICASASCSCRLSAARSLRIRCSRQRVTLSSRTVTF